MSNLGAALGWKYDHEPGISTANGAITEWPTAALGAMPDGAEQAIILQEYDDYLVVFINSSNAKSTISNAINEDIEVLSVMWQVDPESLINMDRAINIATDNPSGPQTITWTLADNSNRAGVTVSDLKEVRKVHGERQSSIVTQYQTWRAGNMQAPFVIT